MMEYFREFKGRSSFFANCFVLLETKLNIFLGVFKGVSWNFYIWIILFE